MPARTSSVGLKTRRTRGLAYSDRKIADPRPMGAATIIAITVTIRLPVISVRMS
jgi:hypothetical protein